jgi:hypothetical protein
MSLTKLSLARNIANLFDYIQIWNPRKVLKKTFLPEIPVAGRDEIF